MDLTIFQYQQLISVVNRLRFPNFWFVNQVPDEFLDGTIAVWDIEKPIIEIDTDFTTLSGEAQPVRMGTFAARTQRMPVTFKFQAFDTGVLMQLRAPGSAARSRAGREYVAREQVNIQRRFGAYLDEFMLSKAFTGSLTIKINGVPTVIDYGIPASHKPTTNGDWSDPAYNILPELTEWKRLVRRDSGFEPRWAIINQEVMNYLINNNFVQRYMAQQAGVQIATTGQITNFFGLQWIVIDNNYAQEGVNDSFDTPFVAPNVVMILPDITNEWVTMQRGTIPIPNQAHNDLVEVAGPAMWAVVSDNPTGLILYYKNARLPALKIPHAIVYARITP